MRKLLIVLAASAAFAGQTPVKAAPALPISSRWRFRKR